MTVVRKSLLSKCEQPFDRTAVLVLSWGLSSYDGAYMELTIRNL